MNKDYIFHVNWEDRYKQSYKVGILAQLDNFFYLILKDKNKAETAYKNGFVGISGFKAEEIYRSRELFDFFQCRIMETNKKHQCKELAESRAVSMTDSFSVDEIPEGSVPKYKEIILKAYELQAKKNDIKNKKEDSVNLNNNKNDNSNVLEEIE